MLFSSMTFIYYFLPVVLILYFCIPVGHGPNSLRGKNSLLLLASFLFYGMGEPVYVFLILASVFVGYLGGRAIEHFEKKWVLVTFVGLQLALLGIFKYTDFFIETINSVGNQNITPLRLVLPIGISFYSFQIISYLVDVSRKDMESEKSFLNFAAYITMFPQLIAGPIVRYDVVQPQMVNRSISFSNLYEGATRFTIGLGKKVLLADNIGELLLRVEKLPTKSVWTYWLIALMYLLQVYHDFSGYSDMAIGLGKMLGFTFPENFNYPLTAKSITDFWRRWHISLSTFLKDYIYIPLGGSRCTVYRWIVNILIVWFLSGLWHGASWNFVLWGMYFGVFLILEKLIGKRLDKASFVKSKFFVVGQYVYTFMVITLSFVLFRFTDLSQVISYFGQLFSFQNTGVTFMEVYEYKNVGTLVCLGLIGATPLPTKLAKKILQKIQPDYLVTALTLLFQLVLLLIVTAFLIQSSVHPFLYFRF